MNLLITFARAYPGRSAAMLGCLVLAALAEGIGLSSMMPLLEIITRSEGSGPVEIDGEGSTLERIVVRILASFGLSPTVGALLSLIVAGICVRAVLVLIAQRQVGYTVAHVATDLRLAFIRALLAARHNTANARHRPTCTARPSRRSRFNPSSICALRRPSHGAPRWRRCLWEPFRC